MLRGHVVCPRALRWVGLLCLLCARQVVGHRGPIERVGGVQRAGRAGVGGRSGRGQRAGRVVGRGLSVAELSLPAVACVCERVSVMYCV